jgi:hypothetical protein
MSYRTYHMTVSTVWYDKASAGAREYELHFTVGRRGKIRTVRRTLAKRGAPYFQRLIHRRTKRWIPLRRIRVRFEREETATRIDSRIRVDGRSMLYRGKRWRAYPLGSWEMNYARKRRPKSS